MQITILETQNNLGCLNATIDFMIGDEYALQAYDCFDKFTDNINNSKPTFIFCSLSLLTSEKNQFDSLKNLETNKNVIGLIVINDVNCDLTHTITSMLEELDIRFLDCWPENMDPVKTKSVLSAAYNYLNKPTEELESANPKLNVVRIVKAINDGSYFPVYQPQYSIKNGTYDSVELLGRLKIGDHTVYPDTFIPILNRQKLISKYTKALLNKALKELKEYKLSNILLSLNIEYQSFQDTGFAQELLGICKENNFPIEQLTLELTETNPQHSFALYSNLFQLKAKGGKVSIDDFGSKDQSFNELKRISFDEVKVDKIYSLNMDKEPNNQSIISSVIELAKKLGVKCVIEGVETKEQLEQLTKLGADFVQGYLFCKPVDIASVADVMIDNNSK